jgi:hypothetical protein
LTSRLQPPTSFRFDPDALFVTDPALDHTLVAVQPRTAQGGTLDGVGWSRRIGRCAGQSGDADSRRAPAPAATDGPPGNHEDHDLRLG